MENPIKMDDLGVTIFLEIPISLVICKLTESVKIGCRNRPLYVKDNATGLLRELDSHGNQELSLDETDQWLPWKMRGDIT